MTDISKPEFQITPDLSDKLVRLHIVLGKATEKCDPRTVPQDILDIETAVAKCSVVRQYFLGDENGADEKNRSWEKVVPRHDLPVATPYRRRFWGILHSAEEIDALPVSMHTKVSLLGAQVRFVKLLRRFRFVAAYKLYTVVIRPWFKS